jgi:hypothetical protein
MNSKKILKPRNLVAKDLLSPKYRLRVAKSQKHYNRKLQKQSFAKEFYAYEGR